MHIIGKHEHGPWNTMFDIDATNRFRWCEIPLIALVTN